MPPLAAAPEERTQLAHDPEAMRELLERHLQPPPLRTFRVLGCRVDHLRRRDGTRSSVQYELRLEEPATGRAWDQVVSGVIYGGGRTRRVWDSLRQGGPGHPGGDGAAGLPPFAYVPELDMLLQVFPHDYRLPALARLVEGPPPALAPPIVARFGPGAWRLEGWQAESVRYRVDQRGTLRVLTRAVEEATGRVDERRFYVKVYRDGEEGRRGDAAQRAVHEGVTAAGSPFAVAEPVAYDDELRALVQTEVAGSTLQEALRRGRDPIPAVRAAARTIALFHGLALAAPTRPAEDDPGRLRNSHDRLRPDRPDLAAAVSSIVDEVAGGLGGEAPTPTHGDLKPDHVLFDGDGVALIDFDLMRMGDPLRDVANFVLHLAKGRARPRLGGDPAGAAVRAFLEEYLARVPAAGRAGQTLRRALAILAEPR